MRERLMRLDILESVLRFVVDEICRDLPVLWTIYPRTLKQVRSFGLWNLVNSASNLVLLEPLGCHEMLRLNMGARLMLTDSGRKGTRHAETRRA